MLYRIPPYNLNEVCQGGQMVFCWLVEKGSNSNTDAQCLKLEEKNPNCVCVRMIFDIENEFLQKLKFLYGDFCFLFRNGEVKWEEYQPDKEVIIEKMKMAIDTRKSVRPISPPPQAKKISLKGIGMRFFK